MPARRLSSPEGHFSLDVPAAWRYEQDGEDASLVMHLPDGCGVVRISEVCHDGGAVSAAVDGEGEACRVGDAPARLRVQACDGRVRRRWVVAGPHSVVHIEHERPADAIARNDEDARVDALLGGLRIDPAPHPAVLAVLRALRATSRPSMGVDWRPSQPFRIASSERGWEVTLENLVRTWDVRPEARAVELAREVEGIRRLDGLHRGSASFEAVRTGLLPVVRTSVLRERVGLAPEAEAPSCGDQAAVCGDVMARRLLAPGLFVYLAVDVPDGLRFVTRAECAGWRTAAADVEAEARENLRRRLAPCRFDVTRAPCGGRVVVCEDGEGLAPSLLLLEERRETLTRALGDGWRVVVPSASVLIAFSADFDAWLEFVGEDLFDAWLEDPMALTPQVYAVDGEGDLMPVEGGAR